VNPAGRGGLFGEGDGEAGLGFLLT
jgi:hypothetical protein